MKITVLGVKTVSGTAKESGNPFNICRLLAMSPIENGGGKNVNVTGYGFELAEIELDPTAFPAFRDVKFPAQLELETDVRPFRGKLETLVVGFKPVGSKPLAAANG